MSIEQKQLDYALDNWDFMEVETLLKSWSEMNISKLPVYCRFLADTGHLDKVHELLQDMSQNVYKRHLIDSESFIVCKNLKKFHKRKYNGYLNEPDFFSKMYHYSMANDLESLSELMNNRGKLINQKTSAEDNMILSFAINRLVEGGYLDVSIIRELISHIAVTRGMNVQRKKYMTALLVDYTTSIKKVSIEFFDLKNIYTVHIRLVPLIYTLSNNEKGADLLMEKVYHFIKKLNKLEMYSEDRKPRVAICISGMFKSDMTNLDSIISTLVKPLDADVFIHTWDRQQEWGGDMRRYNFWPRVFAINNDKVPNNLLNLKFLEINYPEIYNCLLSSSFSDLDQDKLESLIDIDSIVVENEEVFLEKYQIDESFKTRGVYNQVKMFYGLYKSFQLVLEKENQEGFRYDYVIRLRSDTFISSSTIDYEHLYNLANDTLAVPAGSGWGVSDGFFYANRATYEKTIILWREMLLSRRLSPFIGFEDWDAHKLFGLWLIKQNIRPVHCRFSCKTAIGSKSFRVPGLSKALQINCNQESYINFPKETEWLATFLADKAK